MVNFMKYSFILEIESFFRFLQTTRSMAMTKYLMALSGVVIAIVAVTVTLTKPSASIFASTETLSLVVLIAITLRMYYGSHQYRRYFYVIVGFVFGVYVMYGKLLWAT